MTWQPNVRIKVKSRSSLNKLTEDFVEKYKDSFPSEGILSEDSIKKEQNDKYDFIADKTLIAEKRYHSDNKGYTYWVEWTLGSDTSPCYLGVNAEEVEKELDLV